MADKRKQIIFDIDTNVCKQIFGENKFRQPYEDIREFFDRNDCVHIEGSSYMSKHGMSNLALSNLIDDLVEQYPYLTKCIKKMHQADISNIHSLENHFEYDGTAGRFALKDNERNNHEQTYSIHMTNKTSIADRIARKKEKIAKEDKRKSQALRKNDEHDL